MKKYLVTGGTGFLGAALVTRLVKDGHQVRVFDNGSRGHIRRLREVESDIEYFEGDIRDLAAVTKACRGMDSVAHLAYVNGTEFFYTKPDLVVDVAVRGMLAVLDGCKEAGVPELILASSSEAYQTPPVIPSPESVPLTIPDIHNPRYSYGGGKIACELMSMHMGRFLERLVIFRPHNVYGPDMGWEHVLPQLSMRAYKSLHNRPKGPVDFEIQGTGDQTRSFIYIDDFTTALNTVISKAPDRSVVHIGTMDELSIRDVVKTLFEKMGRDYNIVASALPPGGPARRCPDTAFLSSLGFTPQVSFKEGLGRLVDWYSANIHLCPE